MTREEQVERALRVSRQMRANAKKPFQGPSRLKWVQVDAREELARLIKEAGKQAVEDAPPDKED